MINPEFWKNRRVFITGHTGFKGSWLSWWLAQLGAQTTGFSLPETEEHDLYNSADLQEFVSDLRGDIRNYASLRNSVQQTAPEIVIHMAAQSLVRRSYHDPLDTFTTNVIGTAHLLEAIRETPSVRAVVIVTSDKCYANDEAGRAFTEADALGGHDPYSASKAAAELIASSYRNLMADHEFEHPARVATARAGNVVGGGDWAQDRLLPDLARALSHQRELKIRHPHATRPWQHVLEPLHGYLLLSERLFEGRDFAASAWNFGPADARELSVGDVVSRVVHRWGGRPSVIIETAEQPYEAGSLRLDSTKANDVLGWNQTWSQTQAIDRTADWYLSVGGTPTTEMVRAACQRDLLTFLEAQQS